MNEEEEISDEEDQPIKHMMPWITGGLGIMLLYFVSFGPAIFVAIKFRSELPKSTSRTLETVYHPHAALMYHSEGYFNYFLWWQQMANPSLGIFTHANFRRSFENQ